MVFSDHDRRRHAFLTRSVGLLSDDKTERFMLLGRHRKELDSARVRNLSLGAALKLIATPATAPKNKPNMGLYNRTSTAVQQNGT